jgi:hypothetical protein
MEPDKTYRFQATVIEGKPVGNDIKCCESPDDTQCMSALVVAKRLSSFHDASLAEATLEINEILREAEVHAPRGRELSFLTVPGGLFLAWTKPISGPQTDRRQLERELGI